MSAPYNTAAFAVVDVVDFEIQAGFFARCLFVAHCRQRTGGFVDRIAVESEVQQRQGLTPGPSMQRGGCIRLCKTLKPEGFVGSFVT